jgi:hypothetical protein
MIKLLLVLLLPPLTPKGSSLGLPAAAEDDEGASMLCTSTEPVSLDEGLDAEVPLLLLPPPLQPLLLTLLHGYGPCVPEPTRGSVRTSAPLLAFLAATALSAATSSSRVS